MELTNEMSNVEIAILKSENDMLDSNISFPEFLYGFPEFFIHQSKPI